MTLSVSSSLSQGIAKATRAVRAAANRECLAIAQRVATKAAALAPKGESGNLGESVDAVRRRQGAAVRARRRYAAFVELGTRRANQHRFLLPAVDAVGHVGSSDLT